MFLKDLIIRNSLSRNDAFIWDSNRKKLKNIQNFNFLELNLLIGIDRQKDILLKNTLNFANGNFTNNALLWGSRGNGKSSLIKSIFSKVKKIKKSKNSKFY